MVKPREIVRFARSLVGVPYKHRGRNRSGIDCAGVVSVTAKRFRCPFPHDPTDYGRACRRRYVDDQVSRSLDRVATNRARVGMVLIVVPGRSLTHLAIVATMRTMIAASNERDVMSVREELIDWKTVVGVFAFRGVDY